MTTKGTLSAVLVTVLLIAIASAHALAQIHYAIATTPNELFLFRDSGKWGTKSWVRLYNTSPGTTTLAGVATDGRYVYVVDQTSRSVVVGTVWNILDTPIWQEVATIQLRTADGKEVPSPRQIAADGKGGFYVTGGVSGGKAYFAHVKPTNENWTQPFVSIGELPASTIADVAVGKSGDVALIAHIKDSPSTRSSWTCRASENMVSDSYSLLPYSYNARAISVLANAGTDGYAFVANYNSDSTYTTGSIRAVDVATGIPLGTGAVILSPNLIPDDLVAFMLAGNPYLAVIGRTSGTGAAWRISIDPTNNWALIMDNTVSAETPSAGHQCAVSDDGQVFWYTSEDGTLRALRTANWTELLSSEFDGTVGDSAKLTYVTSFSPQVIPEPASIVSLIAFAVGGLTLLRKRVS